MDFTRMREGDQFTLRHAIYTFMFGDYWTFRTNHTRCMDFLPSSSEAVGG